MISVPKGCVQALDSRPDVILFSNAFGIGALTLSHPSEVETERGESCLMGRMDARMDHGVIHIPPELGMRMTKNDTPVCRAAVIRINEPFEPYPGRREENLYFF